VLSTSAELHVVALNDGPSIILRMPAKAIAAAAGQIDAMLARRIPRDTQALRLLVHYAAALWEVPSLESWNARVLVASHMHDLITLIVGAGRDAEEAARGRGLRAARLQAILSEIKAHYAVPTLFSAEDVAKTFGVSARYIRICCMTAGCLSPIACWSCAFSGPAPC
jgi:hypothetical protein